MAHLNYEGLKRYDKKTKEYIEDKIKNIKDIDVNKLATKDDLDTKADKNQLFSGDYNDLQNLPVIPDTTKLATKNELKNHKDDTTIHVTNAEKNTWNNKLDNSALTNYATKTYVTDEVNKVTSASTVDLTPYAKKVDVNASLNNKVDKVVGKSLVDDAEIARLSTINNYNDTDIKNTLSKKADKTELFSGSYNDLSDKPVIPNVSNLSSKAELKNHTDDTTIHVTSAEKSKWNAKLDNTDLNNYATKTYVTDEIAKSATSGQVDLTGYAKTVEVNASLDTKVDKVTGKSLISDTEISRLKNVDNYDDTDIKRSINTKASTSDLNAHTSNNSIHITNSERAKWNAKAEVSDIPSLTNYATKTYVTDEIAKAATSGTVDLTGYAKTVDVNASLDTKVDKVTGKSLVSDTEIARLSTINNYDDTDIKNTLNSKANKTDLNAHTGNTNIHVTVNDKQKWNNKLDNTDLTNYATKTYVTDEINKASLSGGTVDLSDYAKTADVNTSLSNKVNKSGDTMTGAFTIKKSGDNATLLTFDTEKPWSFKQGNTGSDSSLDLVSSVNDKSFRVLNADKTKGLEVRTTPTKTEVRIDGNKVYHSGDKPKLSELTNDAGFITSADVNTSLSNKVDKASITTTIDSTSTDTQVPSAKSIYYNCIEGIEINQTTIDTYGTEILKYPLGIWRTSSNSIASQFTDLPIKVAFRIEITSIDANVNKNPWDNSFSYRVYNFETYMDGNYIRKIESSDTAGVINDTDWQKVCTTSDVNTELDTKVDKIDGKGLSTNDYTTDDKTKVGKIVTSGDGSKFLANDGTYKKVSGSSASAVSERKFKPVFGFDTYWGEMRDNHGNKNQVDLATIKQQIDECEAMKVDRIICTIHIGWDETTNSLVIAENTDSLLTAISYCADKNITIDTAKVHVHFKGTTASEKDYINNTIGMSTFQQKYKDMLNTICNLFKDTTVTRIIILNEMWYITNAKYGYSSFVNECLNIVKTAGYTTGLSMAGFNSNLELPDAVIQNIDTFYINVYPGISGFGSYITKQEAIEAFEQCDIDLWIEKTKKLYPDKKIVISEMGTDDYWENLAAPSTWYINGTSKTGGYAVDTYITAMMEFFINKNVDIEELWWWYNLYYEPVKDTLLNYLGGDR